MTVSQLHVPGVINGVKRYAAHVGYRGCTKV